MPIIRTSKREIPFVQIDKRAINDSSLSWKAKGLLTYFISKPDNWEIKMKDLINQSTDGRSSCRSGLQELEENGYITKQRIRNNKGIFTDIEYQVFETSQPENRQEKTPFKGNKSINGKPDCGNEKMPYRANESTNGFSTPGLSTSGKSFPTNNDSNNNYRTNNKKPTTKENLSEITPEMKKVIQAWNDTFEVVVDDSDRQLLEAIARATQAFEVSDLLQAIEYRSQAKFYKEEVPYLRDDPKSFFRYPQTIKNDMNRRPYKLITYNKKCQLEQEGTDKRFEMDPQAKDPKGQPKWRMYD